MQDRHIGKTIYAAINSGNPMCPASSHVQNRPPAIIAINQTSSAAPRLQSFKVDNDSDSDAGDGNCLDDVEFLKQDFVKTNKNASLPALSNTDYDLNLSPTGWLTCDIIQKAQL